MRILRALPFLALAAACSAESSAESLGSTSQPVIGGSDSDASQDAVGLIIIYDPKTPSTSAACSGTFLTPRLILTARHCVASTEEAAACGSDGKPTSGGAVYNDFPVGDLYVFAGSTRPDFTKGLGGGGRAMEIIDDGSKFLCNHDMALILTDKPVPGAKISSVRLDPSPAPKVGDKLTIVGWGIADKTDTPKTRQQRGGIKVTAVGPADYAGPAEFVVDEGACSGDSGGPAFASSGAVTGILSRGGNGTTDPGKDGCVGGINVYTQPAAYKDVILAAYQKAGQDPWSEGQPNPLFTKLGGDCAVDADCPTNACDPSTKKCSIECTGTGCPDGYSCGASGTRNLCVVGGGGDDKGCGASSASSRSNGVWLLAALAFVVSARRRKAVSSTLRA